MKVGVFDSGIGGLSVVQAIETSLPEIEVIFVNDTANVPYGAKSPTELKKLVVPILVNLASRVDVIVIACNTVSTVLVDDLRKILAVPIIAMEPMIKPAAALTKSKTIAVCATPATLQSKRYNRLKATYAQGVKVVEPDCSEWSYMIESNSVDRQKIKTIVDRVCDKGADVIVLGCTHYHWIQDIITQNSGGRARVIQPEKPVIKQLQRVIAQLA